MLTLEELHRLLGKPRYAVDVSLEATGVRATWPCGCRAYGTSFSNLLLAPCQQHGDAAASQAGRDAPESDLI
jgi:hypothetical protein